MDGRLVYELLASQPDQKLLETKKETIRTNIKTDWGTYELLLERSVTGKYSYVNFSKVTRTFNNAMH
jgi:hypothetical protein